MKIMYKHTNQLHWTIYYAYNLKNRKNRLNVFEKAEINCKTSHLWLVEKKQRKKLDYIYCIRVLAQMALFQCKNITLQWVISFYLLYMESWGKTKKPQNRYLGKFSKKFKTSDTWAGISKNYCAKKQGFQWRLSWGSVHGLYCLNARPKVSLRWQDLRLNTRTQNG